MNSKFKQLVILTALSICSIVLFGCSISKSTLIEKKKFHIYECKGDKLICNLSDSTTIVIYPGHDQDKSTLDLFENGIVTVNILKDIVDQNSYGWNEFEVIKHEVTRTYSDTCKESIEDEKTVFIEGSSSTAEADGNTLYNFSYFTGGTSELFYFEVKKIKQNHFAVRFRGVVL